MSQFGEEIFIYKIFDCICLIKVLRNCSWDWTSDTAWKRVRALRSVTLKSGSLGCAHNATNAFANGTLAWYRMDTSTL